MSSIVDRDAQIQQQLSEHFVDAVSGLFECMGRALICLDRDFQIVHVSGGLDTIAGPGAHEQIIGLPVERVLGTELFGSQGGMRQALLAGERREGWGASLTIEGRAPQLLSVTAASVERVRSSLCDPRVIYMVVVRSISSAPPTEEPPVRFFAGMTGRSPAMLRMFNFIGRCELCPPYTLFPTCRFA